MAPTLITLTSFDLADGFGPLGGLTADANGDLFGTTSQGGTDTLGTVFELRNTGTLADPSYASTPTVLVNFNNDGSNGYNPYAGLTADSNGDLFGTTKEGGTDGYGTVFELQNTGTLSDPSYASTPTVLVSFNGSDGSFPVAGLTVDANGDLFGTTPASGPSGPFSNGTVFELQNTGTLADPSYASTPTVLVNFNYNDGESPKAGLIADAKGDLFGTTAGGGTDGYGTVFELQNTGTLADPIYVGAPTVLVSFDVTDGSGPIARVTADANGNLFGTTFEGGTDESGTVFELQNTGTLADPSYANSPTVLVSFNVSDGGEPRAGLITDAKGDLFGTTSEGGTDNAGVVFELQNTGTLADPSYASTPTVLVNLGSDGGSSAGLIADANGDLFGTAGAGYYNDGNVFEITNSGYIVTHVAQDFNGAGTSDILLQNGSGALVDWMIAHGGVSAGNYLGTDPGWNPVATGDFNGSAISDVLMQYSNGTVVNWGMQNGTVATAALVGNTSGYAIVGTGDFSGDGTSDILLQNSSGVFVDWMMNDGAVQTGNYLGTAPGWNVVGTGDFTADGVDGILLQNGAGAVVDWTMQNGVVSGGALVGQAGGYNVVGTGDFSGNGTSDILLQDSAGDLVDWMMSNGAVTAAHYLGTAAGWTVAAIGDYTGNGVSDILLTNSGNVVDWTMANGVVSGASLIGNTAGFSVKH